jgi:outer membrane protein OmpA-like peptidoglycan-associated protein
VKEDKLKTKVTEPNIVIENNEKTTLETPKTDWFYRLEGKVFEKKSKQPIENADITTIETTGNKKNKVNSDKNGKYSIPLIKNEEYLVTATYKNLFPQDAKILISADDTSKVIQHDFYLSEIYTLRVNFPTDVFDAPYRYVLDSNGLETNVMWDEVLNSLANNILTGKETLLKIVLIGHTDDVASEEYNLKLGERRVNFIIEQLIKRGVPKDILEGRSAGESELLERMPGESLDLYRKRCRRVVLEKVLK